MKQTKDETFQMRVDKAFLHSINEWRRKQIDLPPCAEAIRRLVALALEAEAEKESTECD